VGRLIGAALLALLLAQWTALMHAIAHAPLATGAVVSAEADADADSLWHHAANSPSCELIDKVLLGHSTTGDASPGVWQLPEATLTMAPKYRRVRSAARQAYEARAPPRA